MRFFLFFLMLCLTSKIYPSKANEDSLYVEKIRKEAVNFYKSGNIIQSIEKIKLAISVSDSTKLPKTFVNNRLLTFLANRYSNIGDFDRAIELAKSLESYYHQKGDLKNEVETKNNLGVYHQNAGRNKVAYQYFLEGWQLQKLRTETLDKLDLLDGLSASCIELGKLKEAKIYLIEAEKLLRDFQSEWREVLLLYFYINQSNYALAISDNTQAEKYLLSSIKIVEKFPIRKGADAYRLLASLYFKQGKYEQTLSYAEKIVSFFRDDQNKLAKDPYLVQAYLLQAKALLRLNRYEDAILNCEKIADKVSFLQRQYMFDESKLYLGEIARENLEVHVMALHTQYLQTGKQEYLEQALVYLNRAKSNVLNERWINSKVLSLDDRKDAITLRRKLIYQISKKEAGEEVIVLRNRLDSLNQKLNIKEAQPFLLSDFQSFQNSLTEEEVWLQYLEIDTLLFRFDIQKDKITWTKEELETPEIIFDFYDALSNQESTPQEFVSAFNKLPNLLPNNLLDTSSIKRINFILDGALNYIAFDAIPSNPESKKWKDMNYLVERYNFSYHFSLQSSGNSSEPQEINTYVGFAPDYSQSEEWATLKNSQESLEQAQDYFGGELYLGEQASKKRLHELCKNANVLHLYTHGVSNDSSYDASYIMLQDGKMKVDEVLNLPLKAKLCFLTACEVGLGKQFKGEGITSIAWAFKGAGAENVVQSMWKLNEQSTHELMNFFFKSLTSKTNSSEALTKAKQQYLKSEEISDRLKHPHYWAGVGHYGSGAVFHKKADDWEIFFLAGVLVLLGCLALWKYTSKA